MSRKQHNYHYIYKTTCNVTGRYYIGMHSTSNLEDGYIGSGKQLWLSINKHGKTNHSKEILEFLENRQELKIREVQLVNSDLLNDPLCMNLMQGGKGGLNRNYADWSIQQKHDITVNATIRSVQLRKEDPEFEKKRASNFSMTMKKKIVDGEYSPPSWKGKKLKNDHRKHIGEANSVSQKGKKNSQYGKIWIHNENKSKLIKKKDIDQYLLLGWIRGRKMNFNHQQSAPVA